MIPASWQDATKSFFTNQAANQEISDLPRIPVLLLCLQKPATASYYDSAQSIRSFTPCFIMTHFNLLKPTDIVMHHQFNIQQLYALPTPYLCVLYLSHNKQRLVPLTA